MATDRKEYLLQYAKDKYKRIPLDVKISDYEAIKTHAEQMNESINGFIKRAIAECIANDNKPPKG